MALILCIETATNICSVALADNGNLLQVEEQLKGKASHSSLLTEYIDSLFSKQGLSFQQLDAVAISGGPGSYTGLRIGSSIAKAFSYSLEIPLISLSTLACLTEGAKKANNNKEAIYFPMIDARRMDVYTAAYDQHGKCLKEVTFKNILENFYPDFSTENQNCLFFGDGAEKGRDCLEKRGFQYAENQMCTAVNMVGLAENAFREKQFENTAYYEPEYLKSYIPNISKKNVL